MSALGQRTTTDFENLTVAARENRLSVEDVFAALRDGRITEEQAKLLLNSIQLNFTPRWQRIIVGSGSIG